MMASVSLVDGPLRFPKQIFCMRLRTRGFHIRSTASSWLVSDACLRTPNDSALVAPAV